MYKELDIYVGKKSCRVFLQRGFSPAQPPTKRMHKHNYSDIHIVFGGRISFLIGDETYDVEDGTLIAIPREVFHYCPEIEEGAVHVAFQLDYPVGEIIKQAINPEIIDGFCREIAKVETTRDYTRLASYLSLFCSYLCKKGSIKARDITDYGFLIREFFQTRYSKDVKLSDLANVLNVCERQAERLCVKYTGRTFREELAFMRVTISKHLIKAGTMPLTEIAQYVGYHSYAGFWKAIRKYDEEYRGE